MLDEITAKQKIEKLRNLHNKVKDKIPEDFSAVFGKSRLVSEDEIEYDLTTDFNRTIMRTTGELGVDLTHKWILYLNDIYRKLRQIEKQQC